MNRIEKVVRAFETNGNGNCSTEMLKSTRKAELFVSKLGPNFERGQCRERVYSHFFFVEMKLREKEIELLSCRSSTKESEFWVGVAFPFPGRSKGKHFPGVQNVKKSHFSLGKHSRFCAHKTGERRRFLVLFFIAFAAAYT